MQMDAPTMLAFAAVLLAVLGVVYTFVWSRENRNAPLLWFALPFLASAIGAAYTAQQSWQPDVLGLRIGSTFILLSYGLTWQAVRVLYQRKPLILAATLPPLFLLALSATVLVQFPGEEPIGELVRPALLAVYCTLAAREFRLGKFENLPSRRILRTTFITFAVLHALRIPFVKIAPLPIGIAPMQPWAVLVYVSLSLIFLVLWTTFMISLMRERQAAHHLRLATHDAMTGVYNRRAYFGEAEKVAGQPFAMIVMDIDGFKKVNDRFGHEIGDEVIVLAAQAAVRSLRKQDSVFRIGGEEFVCLLPGAGVGEGERAAEHIRLAFFEAAKMVRGRPVAATVSLGVAASAGGDSPRDLFPLADAAMYRAKNEGRNRTALAEAA